MKAKIAILLMFLLMVSQSLGLSKIDLGGNWLFSRAEHDDWKAAIVPGSVHTDLEMHGLIPDPFYRFNEDSVQWVENCDWEYISSFSITTEIMQHDHIDLVFEGVDTYADVFLNGRLILRADNMFLKYTCDIRKALKPGENHLRVYFHSAVKRNLAKAARLPYRLQIANEKAPDSLKTRPFSRKAPFHFGWDWGPRLVTCGIWRPVYIRAWNDSRLENIYFRPVRIDKKRASYVAELEVKSIDSGCATASVSINDADIRIEQKVNIKPGTTIVEIPFSINQPRLWWPNGLGEAFLYRVEVCLESGGAVESVKERLGVRSLELVQKKDPAGRSFYFRVNGIPLFIKGANYIPPETITTRISNDRYKRVIDDALMANMNMLRVWGGAIYENEIFYDLCDENGLLVWQDFMFACEMNPGDDNHLQNIRKEAEYNVKRLRHHPCIALWCGNNENLVAWHEWEWKDKYPKQRSDSLFAVYERIFHDILPAAVNRYQPGISYWASSPGGYPGGRVMRERTSGDEHDWNIWFGPAPPFEAYEERIPRFVSEYGLQSYPEMKTLRAFALPGDLHYRSRLLTFRQRSRMPWIAPAMDGNSMILEYIRMYFGEPVNFSAYVYLSQITQAWGLKTAIEIHRRNRPHCMGSMYWQLNDCWPTMSWSTVDYFGRWKAAHYAVRRAFEMILISTQNTKIGMQVYIISDSTYSISGQLEIRVFDFKGNELTSFSEMVEIPPLSSGVFATVGAKTIPVRKAFVEITLKDNHKRFANNISTFVRYRDLELLSPSLAFTLHPEEKRIKLKITSNRFTPFVRTSCTKEGRFDQNFFHLLPGQTRTLYFYPGNKENLPGKKDFQVYTLTQSLSNEKKYPQINY